MKAIAEERVSRARDLIHSQLRDYVNGLPHTLERRRAELYHQGLRLKDDLSFEQAIDLFRQALEQPGAEAERVALLILMGSCYLNLVDLAEAEAHYRQAEALATSISDGEGKTIAGHNLEVIRQIKDDLEEAFVASPEVGIKQRIKIANHFVNGLKSQLGVRR